MKVEIRCPFCGRQLCMNMAKNEFDADGCPLCKVLFNSSKVLGTNTAADMDGSVRSGSLSFGHHVVSSDLKEIKKLYFSSDPTVQGELVGLIDKFFLLIFTDVQNGDISKLSATRECLNKLFWDKVTEGHKDMREILGISADD